MDKLFIRLLRYDFCICKLQVIYYLIARTVHIKHIVLELYISSYFNDRSHHRIMAHYYTFNPKASMC